MAAAESSSPVKVFAVYHPSKEDWLETYILPILEDQSVLINLLHRDRTPGENFFNAIQRAIEDPSVRILVVFSPDFQNCRICAFFSQKLPTCVSQEGKVIPLCTEGSKPPDVIADVAYLTEGTRHFSKRLMKALDRDAYGSPKQYTPPRCMHIPKLFVKEKPAGKVRALPEWKQRRFHQSNVDEAFDHKVVLSQDIRFPKSMALDMEQADISFDIEVGSVTLYGKRLSEEFQLPQGSDYVKVTPRRQVGKVSTTEAAYFVRIQHPKEVTSVSVYLRFDLKETNNRDGSTEVVDCCWVTLYTEDQVKKETISSSTNDNLKQRNIQSEDQPYDADSEDDIETPRKNKDVFESSKSHSLVETIAKVKGNSKATLGRREAHHVKKEEGRQSIKARTCAEASGAKDKMDSEKPKKCITQGNTGLNTKRTSSERKAIPTHLKQHRLTNPAVTNPKASPKIDKGKIETSKRKSEPQVSTRVKTNTKDTKGEPIHPTKPQRKVQGQGITYPRASIVSDTVVGNHNNQSKKNICTETRTKLKTRRKVPADRVVEIHLKKPEKRLQTQVMTFPKTAAQKDSKDDDRSMNSSLTSVVARTKTERRVTVDKVVVIHLKMPQRRRQSSGLLFEKECRDLLLCLDELSQSSKDDYRKLIKQTGIMLEHYTERKKWDYMILIYIKLIGAAHYRDDIKSAKKYMKEVGSLLSESIKNKALLTGRALIYKTAIYREKSKFAKAENAALQAISVLQDVEPGEDTAKAHFNYGKYFMKRLETMHTGNIEEFQNCALEQFTLAMDHYMRTREIDFGQVNRCLLNMARVRVNCPLTRVKQHGVSDEHEMRKKLLMQGPLNNRSTEQAKIFMETLKGHSAMGDVSKRNQMQILYTEAEITFIEALCILQEGSNQNDPFYEKISCSIFELEKACTIAQSGGYKESTSASNLLGLLRMVYSKRKARNTIYREVTAEDLHHSGSSSESHPGILVYTSGFENLSSGAESASTHSDSDRLM